MKIKRLLALLLSLCLVAALAVPVIAEEDSDAPVLLISTLEPAEEDEDLDFVDIVALEEPIAITEELEAPACDCGEVLQVFVRGFMNPLYYDYGTDQQKEAFILGHLLMNDQGESVLDIDKYWLEDDVSNHADEPEFEFLFDYRLDPFKSARELDEYIEYLCGATGHSKIALTGMSQGTSIVTTYLATYGYDRLETLILISGSYMGVSVIGELLTNRWALSVPGIINLLATMGASPLFKAFMNLLGVVFAPFETGPSSNLAFVFGGRIYNRFIMKLIGQMPAIWTFLPVSYFEQARKLLDADPKWENLRVIADAYYEQVLLTTEQNLRDAKDAGVKVGIIAHYGKAPIPLIKKNDYQTDILIDTEYGSCGATVATIGKVLDPVGVKDLKYFSPDHIIDAGTCNLPDQTWFIKYVGHDFVPSHDLRMWFIHHDVEKDGYPTVFSNAEYPQYLRLTEDKEHTVPLVEEPAPAPTSIIDAFKALFAAIGG